LGIEEIVQQLLQPYKSFGYFAEERNRKMRAKLSLRSSPWFKG
jgi:hypothetical protein